MQKTSLFKNISSLNIYNVFFKTPSHKNIFDIYSILIFRIFGIIYLQMTWSYRVGFCFSSTFPLDLLLPTFPSFCLLLSWFGYGAPSESCLSCMLSALDCWARVCCSCMNYGNKETFKFFKTEAIKQMGITALRRESNSQGRGPNNRMGLGEPIDVGWGLSAEALGLNM